MSRWKLCPVCRKRYYESRVINGADLLYVHYTGNLDGQPALIGCVITDNSEISGVSFRPDRLPKPKP